MQKLLVRLLQMQQIFTQVFQCHVSFTHLGVALRHLCIALAQQFGDIEKFIVNLSHQGGLVCCPEHLVDVRAAPALPPFFEQLFSGECDWMAALIALLLIGDFSLGSASQAIPGTDAIQVDKGAECGTLHPEIPVFVDIQGLVELTAGIAQRGAKQCGMNRNEVVTLQAVCIKRHRDDALQRHALLVGALGGTVDHHRFRV